MIPTIIDAVIDIAKLVFSGVLVLIGFSWQAKYAEQHRQKDRTDNAKKEKLLKLEELLREVGQLFVHLTKLQFAFVNKDTAQKNEQRASDALAEILTLTDIYFNELIEYVYTVYSHYTEYTEHVKGIERIKAVDKSAITDESIDMNIAKYSTLITKIDILNDNCRKLAKELQ